MCGIYATFPNMCNKTSTESWRTFLFPRHNAGGDRILSCTSTRGGAECTAAIQADEPCCYIFHRPDDRRATLTNADASDWRTNLLGIVLNV